MKVLITQSCLTLFDPMDCSPPGSSVHGILQTRILEWIAFPSPGDLPNLGIEPGSHALQADSLLCSYQGITWFLLGGKYGQNGMDLGSVAEVGLLDFCL